MKLSQLKDGHIVVKTSKKDDYRYITPSDTIALGIVFNGAVITSGVASVYIYGRVRSGQSVRARLSGERGPIGGATGVLKEDSGPYIHIGVALGAGRDRLIPVALNIGYTAGAAGLEGPPGPKGDPGDQGPPGSDASVTKANIEAALTGEITSHTHPSSGGLTQAQIMNLL